MKLLVAVPSKGRADTIFKHTLRWLPRTGLHYKVFVEPQEIEAYREGARNANYENYLEIKDEDFIDIGATDKGLGFAKDFIKDYATKNGYGLVFKMDDDVKRFRWRGRNKPDEEMILLFHGVTMVCRKAFDTYPDVAAIGFGYGHELVTPKLKEWRAINECLQSCYMIRTEYIQGGFDTWEDFAQFIYIRSQNKVTLRYGLAGIDCIMPHKNAGGLQSFDRIAMAKDEAERLKKIYPALQFKDKNGQLEPDLSGEFFGTITL